MLSQPNTAILEASLRSARMRRTEAVWDGIEAALRRHGRATTSEIAAEIDLSPSAAQARLMELRELGEVRLCPARSRSTVRVWELGMEEFVAKAESMKPVLSKAIQLGAVRDPLVAALFGTHTSRCVSCDKQQPEPHQPEYAFNGVDIDAAHHNYPIEA